MRLFGRSKSRKRLDEVLQSHQPPTFPQGVMRLLKLLRDPNAEVRDIAAALSWDPGLVVRVLKLVNSAAFGRTQHIDSVQHAVTMLGRSQLEQIVLGVAVRDNLPRTPARGFEPRRFWRAAFFRASLASAFADVIHPAEQARSFIGALLQDMAVPLLAHARPVDYCDVLESWHRAADSELHVLEKQALGFSHDEIGGHLGTEWELPESLTRVIELHHHDEASDSQLPPALRLVALHRETEREHGIDAMVENARHMYGLKPDWTRLAVQQSDEQATELAQSLA